MAERIIMASGIVADTRSKTDVAPQAWTNGTERDALGAPLRLRHERVQSGPADVAVRAGRVRTRWTLRRVRGPHRVTA
ncbi:hypothetical protein GCM10009834_46910 [Streptomonospora arabica]